jgi:hypothetical protein
MLPRKVLVVLVQGALTLNHRSCGLRACPEDLDRRVPRNNRDWESDLESG